MGLYHVRRGADGRAQRPRVSTLVDAFSKVAVSRGERRLIVEGLHQRGGAYGDGVAGPRPKKDD